MHTAHPRRAVSSARIRLRRAILTGGIAALLGASISSAGAATYTWQGGTDANWAASANWGPSTGFPGALHFALFNGLGNGNTTLDLGAGVSANSIFFDSANVAAYTLGLGPVNSQTLTLAGSGGISLSSTVAAAQTVNGSLLLGTDAGASTTTLTNHSGAAGLVINGTVAGNSGATAALKTLLVSGAGATQINGAIGNGGALSLNLTKTGAGTLTLQGDNPLTGVVSLRGGALLLSEGGRLAAASGLSLSNRAVLTLQNAGANLADRVAGPLTSAGGTLNFQGNAVATSETLGDLTLNAGALTINATAGAGGSTLTIPSITRNAGGTLYVNGTGVGGGTNQVVLTTANALTNTILPWAVVNNGTVTRFATHGGDGTSLAPQTAGGSYQTSQANWGANTVNALVTSDQNIAGSRTAFSLTLDSTFDISSTSTTTDRTITLGDGTIGAILQTGGISEIRANSTADVIVDFTTSEGIVHVNGTLNMLRSGANNFSGTGGITKTGPGLLSVQVNGNSGILRLNEGAYRASGSSTGALGVSATGIQFNGGNLELAHTAGLTYTAAGPVTLNADAAITQVQTGAGVTHTLQGALTIGDQTLTVGKGGGVTADSNYGVTFSNSTVGATLVGAPTFQIDNNGTGIGTLTLRLLNNPSGFGVTKQGTGDLVTTTTAATGFNGNVDIQAGRIGWGGTSGTITEPGIISGAGGLLKSGASVVRLTGANTYTGSTTITAGVLEGNIGTGNLALTGGVYQSNGSFARSLGAGVNQVQMTSGGFAAAGGPLTVALSGAPDPLVWDVTPFFTTAGGTLTFGSSTADEVVTFLNNVDLNSQVAAVTRTFTANDNTGSTLDKAVLSGIISNGAGATAATVAKAGTGVLELAGANTFSGPITVSGGTLQFSTVSDTGAANNLGTGNLVTLSSSTSRLEFVGSSNAATSRQITATAITFLGASGTNGATLTYNGAVTAGGSSFILDGSGFGIFNGTVTQTGVDADLIKRGPGTWRIDSVPGQTDNIIAESGTLLINVQDPVLKTNPGLGEIFIRNGTVKLSIDNAFTNATGAINVSTESQSGGILDLNGKNAGTPASVELGEATFTGSILDSTGNGATLGGTLTPTVFLLLNGTISSTVSLAGAGALTKSSANTVTMFGANPGFTGTTSVSGGTLALDYTQNNGEKLSNTAALSLASGSNLVLTGSTTAATTESVGGLTIGDQANSITVNAGAGQSATLNLDAITRAARAGTVDFRASGNGVLQTTSANQGANSLAGWALFNSNRFASINGGTLGQATTAEKDAVATWATGENVTDSAGYFGTTGTKSIESLAFNGTAASTVTIEPTATLTIANGGILVSSSMGAAPAAISGGVLASGLNNEIIVSQLNATTPFAIGSSLRGPTALTKAGAGTVVLSGNSIGNGVLTVQQGTVQATGGNAVGDYSIVNLKNFAGVFFEVPTGQTETVSSFTGGGTSGGRVNVGGTLTIANSNGATTTFAGQFTGAGTLNVQGANILQLSGATGTQFTGTVNIANSVPFLLDDASTFTGASAFNINGSGYLYSLQNQSTTTDKLGNTATITLNNTATNYGLRIRNENQGALRIESVGGITLGAGHNSIVAEGASVTGADPGSQLTAASLTRNSRATLVVRGLNLGNATTANTARGRVVVTEAPAGIVGGGTVAAGTGTAGTQTLSIYPYMVGDASSSAITALGNTFVTLDAGNSLRPLNTGSEYTLNKPGYDALGGTTANNVRFTASSTVATGSKTINSLVLDSSGAAVTMTGNAGDTLTLTSGALLATAAGTTNAATITGFSSLATDGVVDYTIFVTSANTLTLNPQFTSAVPLVKSGAGALVLGPAASNAFTDVYFNQGLIEANDLAKLGTGSLSFLGGGLRWGTTGSAYDPSTRTITFGSGGGTFDVQTRNITIANPIGGNGVGGLTKAGSGSLTLNAPVSYNGTTTVTAGSLIYGVSGALPATANVVLTSTLDTGGFATTLNGLTVNSSTAVINVNAPLTIAGNSSASGGGSRTLTLNGTGLTTFNGGAFTLVDSGATARTFTFAGTGDVAMNSVIQDGSMPGSLTINNSGANGTVLLNARNVYTGTTTLTRGNLKLGTSNAIAANATNLVTFAPAALGTTAQLDLNGFDQTLAGLTTSPTAVGSSNIDNSSANPLTLTIGSANQAVAYIGGISQSGGGAVSLVKVGTGAGAVSGPALNYTGSTTVTGGGSLVFSGSPAATTGSLQVLGANSTLKFTSGLVSPGAITSLIVNGGATFSLFDGAGAGLAALTTLNLGSGSALPTTLELDAGTMTDTLALLTGNTAVVGNNIVFNIRDNGLEGLESYTLLSAPGGGLATGAYTLGTAPGGFQGFSLNVTDTAVQLLVGNAIIGPLYYTNSAANGRLNAAGNFTQDKAGTVAASTIPGSGTTLIFQGDTAPGGAVTATLEQNIRVNDIVFDTSANPVTSYTIAPGAVATNRLNVAPQAPADGIKLVSGGAKTVNIAAPLNAGSAQTWALPDADMALNVTGGLTGTGPVTLTGPGVVNVSSANTAFNGGFVLNGGPLTLTATGTGTNNFEINGPISGAATNPITKNGAGVLTFGGTAANTYPGLVRVTTGTLQLGKTPGVSAVGGNLEIASATPGTTIRLLAADQIPDTSSVTLTSSGGNGSRFELNGFAETIGSLTITGTTQTGTFVSTGPGNVLTVMGDIALNNHRDASGNNGREVLITGTGNFATAAANSGILDLGGAVRTITTTTNNAQAGTDATIETTIRNGGINKAGARVLILTGDNTYLGGTTVSAGTLRVGAGGTTGSIMGDAAVNTGATLEFNRSDSSTFGGVLSGAGTLRKAGTGSLKLTGASTFTGPITIAAGALQYETINNNGAGLSNLGQGTDGITMSGGRLEHVGAGDVSTDRKITFTATSRLVSSTPGVTVTYNGDIAETAGQVYFDGAGNSIFNGTLTMADAAANFEKFGSGTLTVTKPLGVADTAIAWGGTLNLMASAAGTGDLYSVGNGTVVNLHAVNTWTGDDIIIRGGRVNLHVNGAINGAATNQAGDVFISAESGVDNIAGGILDIRGTTGSTAATANFTYLGFEAAAGTLIDSIGGGSYGGNFIIRNGEISANLAGAGSIQKSQNRPGTLSGNNSGFTGTAVIQDGELFLDYTNNNGEKLSDTGAGALTGSGGAITLKGSSSAPTVETLGGVTLNNGRTVLTVNAGTGQTATLNLNNVTRTAGNGNGGGTLDLVLSPNATVTTAATPAPGSSVLGYVTLNGTNFAGVSGGAITPFASVAKNAVGTWQAGDDITDAGTGFTGALTNTVRIGSLRFAANAASQVTIGNGARLQIASGGILRTADVGGGESSISGGILEGAANELIVHQHNTSGPLFISSTIQGATALSKTGPGTLVLGGVNSYSGQTSIGEGILAVGGGSAIGDYSLVVLQPHTNATLSIGPAGETIGALASNTSVVTGATATEGLVTLSGGALTINNSVASRTYRGDITGQGALIHNGASNSLFMGALPGFTGPVVVNAGSLELQEATLTFANVPSFTINGPGQMLVEQESGANVDHIANTATITLNNTNTAGTRGFWLRNPDNDLGLQETVGTFVLGAGHNTIAVDTNNDSSTANTITLNASTLTRNNHATLLVRGHNLGSATTVDGRINFSNAPAGAVGGAGAAGTTKISIVPYLIGEAIVGTDTDFTNNLGNSFVTNTGTTAGLRPLDLATEYVSGVTGYNGLPAGANTDNVRFTAGGSLTGGSRAINSLVADLSTADVALVGDAADTLTITSGGVLATAGTGTRTHSISGFAGIATTAGADYIFYTPTATTTLSVGSPLTTATPLVKSGLGTLVLTQANANTDVYFNQGLIQADAPEKLGTGKLSFFGGGLRWGAGTTFDISSRAMEFGTGGAIFDVQANDVVLANAIGGSGTGTFTKGGAGALTLNAPVAYTGRTIISAGTLSYGVANTLPATMDVTLGGGALGIGANASTLNSLTVGIGTSTTSTITGSADLNFTGNVILDGGASRTLAVNNSGNTSFSGASFTLVGSGATARTFTLSGSGNTTIASRIEDGVATGTLAITNSGRTTLLSENTYSGVTTITGAGALRIANGLSLGAASAGTTVNSGASLELTNNITLAEPLTISGTGSGGNGALRSVSGNNVYRGRVTLGAAATIQTDSGTLTLEPDATGIVIAGSISATITGAADTILIGDVALGTGTLIKNGGGFMQMQGNSSYTGATTVNDGALILSGSIASGLVNVSGTGSVQLAGTGADRVSNTAEVRLNGGSFGFANNTDGGTETVGLLDLTANSTINLGLGSAPGVNGNSLVLAGFASLSDLDTFTLTIQNWSGNRYELYSTEDSGDLFQDRLLFSSAGLAGITDAQLQNIRFYSDTGVEIGYGKLIPAGGDLQQIVPVPEPSSTALLASAALLGLRRFRRRKA